MLKRRATLAAFALIAMLAPPAGAQTPPAWTQAGMLKCKLNPSIGFIIAGHQSMECTFVQNGSYSPQAYWGALNMVGLDIGFTAGGVLGWAGEYVGASGDASFGVGVGANVLVGGSGHSFALQPVSLEGSAGVNVAIGVSALKLRAAP